MKKPPPALFKDIPQTIQVAGRVKGFEHARDEVFQHWEALAGSMPAYNAIRLALEFDKHALMAQVAQESKGKDAMDWDRFQRWLSEDPAPAIDPIDKEDE